MGNIWVNPKASGIVSPFPFTPRFQEPFWGQKNQKSRVSRDFFVGIFRLKMSVFLIKLINLSVYYLDF